MGDVVLELLIADVAAAKLAKRAISDAEVEQLLRNANVTVRNPSSGAERRLLIGRSDGGRTLTVVIERTIEPSAWLVVTGWTATRGERRMLEV
jgi:uncharacterized DUF497 family protein